MAGPDDGNMKENSNNNNKEMMISRDVINNE